MPRVKLELPGVFEFSTNIPVRITDINYGGHLGNDSLLSFIHEARLQFLNSKGFSEMDAGGVGIILTDVVIIYKSESFFGDILNIEVTAGDFNKYGCDIYYRINNKKNNKEAARAKTGIVFYDYKKKKITSTPETFLRKMKH